MNGRILVLRIGADCHRIARREQDHVPRGLAGLPDHRWPIAHRKSACPPLAKSREEDGVRKAFPTSADFGFCPLGWRQGAFAIGRSFHRNAAAGRFAHPQRDLSGGRSLSTRHASAIRRQDNAPDRDRLPAISRQSRARTRANALLESRASAVTCNAHAVQGRSQSRKIRGDR